MKKKLLKLKLKRNTIGCFYRFMINLIAQSIIYTNLHFEKY